MVHNIFNEYKGVVPLVQ